MKSIRWIKVRLQETIKPKKEISVHNVFISYFVTNKVYAYFYITSFGES